MPSNFKKKVRARMQETGESWQTAQRHVRAQAVVKLRDYQTAAIDAITDSFTNPQRETDGPEHKVS
jgi:hypothetical protein